MNVVADGFVHALPPYPLVVGFLAMLYEFMSFLRDGCIPYLGDSSSLVLGWIGSP